MTHVLLELVTIADNHMIVMNYRSSICRYPNIIYMHIYRTILLDMEIYWSTKYIGNAILLYLNYNLILNKYA